MQQTAPQSQQPPRVDDEEAALAWALAESLKHAQPPAAQQTLAADTVAPNDDDALAWAVHDSLRMAEHDFLCEPLSLGHAAPVLAPIGDEHQR